MEISLAAEPIFHLGSWGVPNSIIATWAVMLLIFIGVAILRLRGLQTIPHGFQNIIEAVIEFLYNQIQNITGDHKKSRRFFPLVATIFLFIIICNWFGLLPFFGGIGFHQIHEGKEVFVPMFRSANSDLNTTLALAVISVIATHLFGFWQLGFGKHLGKYFSNPLKHNPIMSFVGILELFGELSKMISFSFRLFGNIFAGEVLLIVITGLVAYVAPVPFYFLELFVGFIQAVVFGMLTLIFLMMATAKEH